MKKLTFFGATGMLAQPVILELSRQGFDITALVRDRAKAEKILPKSIKIVEGDLQDSRAVEQVLSQAEGIYINLSVKPDSRERDFQPEREGLENILKLAEGKNIRYIGYLSSLVQRYQGVDQFSWWVFDIKNQAIQRIKNSGIPYLIFYPSTFMENFDKGSYRQGRRINLAGESFYPMYFIAGEDYARQLARALAAFNGSSKEYAVQGPEAFTADEAARIFVQHYRREKLSIAKLPYGVLAFLGRLNPTFNYGANIVKALNNYPEKFESQSTWEELGKPTIRLVEYAGR